MHMLAMAHAIRLVVWLKHVKTSLSLSHAQGVHQTHNEGAIVLMFALASEKRL